MERPSYKELDRKLRIAGELVSEARILTINPAAIAADATELGYLISEFVSILSKVLDEINPKNYVG
jgi:hypothetical protein